MITTRSKIVHLLTVALTALVLLAPPPAPAHAAASVDVQVLPYVGMRAFGAGAAVRLAVTCSGTTRRVPFVVASIRQVTDQAVVTGQNRDTVTCDGVRREVRLGVVPSDPTTGAVGGEEFRPGTAEVTAELRYCDERFVCGRVSSVSGTVGVHPLGYNLVHRDAAQGNFLDIAYTGTLRPAADRVVLRYNYECDDGDGFTRLASATLSQAGRGFVFAVAVPPGVDPHRVVLRCDGERRHFRLTFRAPADSWVLLPAFATIQLLQCRGSCTSEKDGFGISAFRFVDLQPSR